MKFQCLSGLWPLFLAVLVSACDRKPSGPPATHYVTGEAFYLQKIALPEDAVLTVRLEDVSLLDEPAVLISEQRIELDGDQQPFRFKLGYNLEALPQGHVFAVSGRIEDESGLRFINTEQHSLLLTGAPASLRLKLDQVAPGGPAAALSVTPDFACRGNNPPWHLELRKDRLLYSRLGQPIESRSFAGRFARYSALDGAAGYQWQGRTRRGSDATLVAEISLDYCSHSRANPDEAGDYDYRIALAIDDEALQGCCNLLVEEAPPSTVTYHCDDAQQLSARFEGSGTQAVVYLRHASSGDLVLPIQESASGLRYAANGNEFWSKGSEALLSLADEKPLACQVAESRVQYQCDGQQLITVRYLVNAQGGIVNLELADGSELILPQVPSTTAARYAQAGNSFWHQARKAQLKLEGGDTLDCTELH